MSAASGGLRCVPAAGTASAPGLDWAEVFTFGGLLPCLSSPRTFVSKSLVPPGGRSAKSKAAESYFQRSSLTQRGPDSSDIAELLNSLDVLALSGQTKCDFRVFRIGEKMTISQAIAPHLPYLRRFARALTGSQTSGDAYAVAALEAIVAEPSAFDADIDPRLALYKVFLQVWNSVPQRDASYADEQPLTAGGRAAGVKKLTLYNTFR